MNVMIVEDGDVEMQSKLMRTVLYVIVLYLRKLLSEFDRSRKQRYKPTRDLFEGNRSHETRGSSPLKHIQRHCTLARSKGRHTAHKGNGFKCS